jgi:hypothetical protein
MRKMMGVAMTAAGLGLLAAPAHAAVRDWPARDFERVELSGAADATILTGQRFSVHADGDPRLLDRMTADVRQGTLVIGWRPGERVDTRDGHVRITITMPRITGVTRSGAGDLSVDRVDAPDFTAEISGVGNIRLPSVRSRHVSLTTSGAGNIAAAGAVERIDAEISGVGSLDAVGLPARAGQFSVSGTGKLRATVNGPADVTLSGVGRVDIGGRPACTVHKSGLGRVRCG